MLSPKTHPKIPKGLINSPEEYLQQKIQDKEGYLNRRKTKQEEESISQATEYALLKYYPKYCHTIRLDSDSKPRPVLQRIKQIKTISHLEYDFGSRNKKKLLIAKTLKNLLKNKRKSIKSLPIIGFEEEFGYRVRYLPAIEMSYFFPFIETLNVCLPLPLGSFEKIRQNYIPAPMEDYILESYGYFWNYLKHVKHIQMSTDSLNLWVIFPYLQKSQGFLASLQTFRLTILSFSKNDASDHPQKIFQIFLRNPDLLKYVTHINFQRFKDYVDQGWFHYYGDQVKQILDSCPRLQSVIFPIEEEFHTSQRGFLDPKRYLTQAPLQAFNKLTALTLMVYDTRSLIEGFQFPEQLKKLTLRLYYLSDVWRDLYPETKDESLDNFVCEDGEAKLPMDSPLPSFFEKVGKMAELKTLELNMRLFTPADEILNVFVVPMLLRVPQVERFEWNFYPNWWRHLNSIPLDLSIFLKGITSLKNLQSFKISHPVEDDTKVLESQGLILNFSPQAHDKLSFPSINSVTIDALISEDFDFRAFFTVLSEENSSHDCKFKEITLGKVCITSTQHFIKLLKAFKELEQLPKLKIYLSLALILKGGWDDIDKNFEEVIIPAKNVTITLKIYVLTTNRFSSTTKGINALQKIFGKMKFSITQVAKEKTRYGGQKQIFIPFVENNYEYVE